MVGIIASCPPHGDQTDAPQLADPLRAVLPRRFGGGHGLRNIGRWRCAGAGRHSAPRHTAEPAASAPPVVVAASRRELWAESRVDVGDLIVDSTARIRGVVLDDSDRNPVPGAVVSGTDGSRTTSDSVGAFLIESVTAGTLRLLARCEGYASRSTVSLQVQSGENIEGVELRLDLARIITGRVVEKNGGPIAGARIEARRPAVAMIVDGPHAISNVDGFFELGPLPAGEVAAGQECFVELDLERMRTSRD